CGSSVCDITPALLCAYGILTAVLHRQKTGKGQHVDIAMYDAGVFLSDKPVTHYLLAQEEQERGRISHAQPYDVFQAKDGWVVIAITSQPMWQRFCHVMGRADLTDDPRTATGQDRYRNFDSLLKPAIEGWLNDKTRKEAVAILNSVNVPAGEVQTMADIAACPQLQARGMWLELDDPVFGKVRTVANPVKLSEVKPRQPTHYPLVGQDTEAILARFDPDQVPTLRSK
ncbi:MAG: CoA transferase, partial [Chloroflexi bacterium]|nr:CoA transferase [Chloroflexota bacterium]